MTIKPVNKSNFWLGIAMIALSMAGMGHTYLGDWTKKAGEAAKFFPRCIYIGLFIAGAVLAAQEVLHRIPKEPKSLQDVKWHDPVVYALAGAIFFLTVYYIGPMVGIFLYILGMMLVFAVEPKRDLLKIVLATIGCSVGIYLLFTKVIVLVIPGSLLF